MVKRNSDRDFRPAKVPKLCTVKGNMPQTALQSAPTVLCSRTRRSTKLSHASKYNNDSICGQAGFDRARHGLPCYETGRYTQVPEVGTKFLSQYRIILYHILIQMSRAFYKKVENIKKVDNKRAAWYNKGTPCRLPRRLYWHRNAGRRTARRFGQRIVRWTRERRSRYPLSDNKASRGLLSLYRVRIPTASKAELGCVRN